MGALALASAALSPASTAATPIQPGTSVQVHRLVAASTGIKKASPGILSQLSQLSVLETRLAYPAAGVSCLTGCTFGDPTSKREIVLFGDSHVLMWLPAVQYVALKKGYKVVLFWAPACAIVQLPGLTYEDNTTDLNCASYFTNAIAAIKKLSPALVILGERTYGIVSEPSDKPYTSTQWTTALEKTIKELASKTTKVAMLEDIVAFDTDPLECIAAYPTSIQTKCSVPNPNPKEPGQQAAEKAAAKATHSLFVKTIPWLCSSRCSPIIGTYLSHYDQGHLAVPYAQWLAGVFQSAITPDL